MPGLVETGFVADAYVDGLYERFTSFLTDFSPDDYVPPEEDTTQPRSFMAAQLEHMVTSGSTTLAVEYPDLRDYDYDMAAKIVMHYERAEPLLRQAIRDYVRTNHPAFLLDAHGTEKQFFIGISKMDTMEKFRELRTEKIGRLVSFCGTVTRTSEVRPELFLGTFKCQECSTIIQDVEQFYKFTQPLVCSNPQCNNK
jgi:DNA replication licensing factor MCM6